MNNGNGTLCCNMDQNHECCLCNHLVSLLLRQGNETLCSRTGMCFRNETLCCIVWNVFSIMARYICIHEGILHTQSGSDLA